jgi:hypothetical protein
MSDEALLIGCQKSGVLLSFKTSPSVGARLLKGREVAAPSRRLLPFR